MALGSPLFTVDTTSTDGVGTYTLDDPASPGGGLRTLADAVAMGVLSDGDTVEYNVRDKTKEGTALLYEAVVGTVGGSGSTLTRDTVKQNHLGTTAAVDWPSGGSRTVTVSLDPTNVCRTANNLSDVDDADTSADNIGAARLNAAPDFADQVDVVKSVAGVLTGVRVRNTQAAATANFSEIQWRAKTSAAERSTFQVRSRFTATTDGSQTTETLLQQWDGGSFVDVMTLSGSSALDVNDNTFEAFPSGTTLSFGDSAPPAGYTRSNVAADRVVKLAKSGDTGGSNVSQSATITVNSTTLTEAQLASHDHDIDIIAQGAAFGSDFQAWSSGIPGGKSTKVAGGGSSHTHTASISSGFYPQAEIWIKAIKD